MCKRRNLSDQDVAEAIQLVSSFTTVPRTAEEELERQYTLVKDVIKYGRMPAELEQKARKVKLHLKDATQLVS